MKKRIFAGAAALILSASLLGATALARSDDDEVKASRVYINTEMITVRVNQTRTLFATVEPYHTDDKTVYWDTSNPEIVTVDGDGIITGISPGEATVTATSVNGRVGRCRVTVPGYALRGIEADTDNEGNPAAQIRGGEELSAAVLRADAEAALKDCDTAALTYRDKTAVTTTALRSASYTAEMSGGRVSVRMVTSEKGLEDSVRLFNPDPTADAQGWLTLDPALAGTEDYTIATRVVTDPGETGALKKQAEASLGGRAAVIRLYQQGAFGMTVSVAAKADLSGMNRQSINLYSFNGDAGTFSPLKDQSYTVDGGGYIHFSADHGGWVVVTDCGPRDE